MSPCKILVAPWDYAVYNGKREGKETLNRVRGYDGHTEVMVGFWHAHHPGPSTLLYMNPSTAAIALLPLSYIKPCKLLPTSLSQGQVLWYSLLSPSRLLFGSPFFGTPVFNFKNVSGFSYIQCSSSYLWLDSRCLDGTNTSGTSSPYQNILKLLLW